MQNRKFILFGLSLFSKRYRMFLQEFIMINGGLLLGGNVITSLPKEYIMNTMHSFRVMRGQLIKTSQRCMKERG